jgi:hypothetical protein
MNPTTTSATTMSVGVKAPRLVWSFPGGVGLAGRDKLVPHSFLSVAGINFKFSVERLHSVGAGCQ